MQETLPLSLAGDGAVLGELLAQGGEQVVRKTGAPGHRALFTREHIFCAPAVCQSLCHMLMVKAYFLTLGTFSILGGEMHNSLSL